MKTQAQSHSKAAAKNIRRTPICIQDEVEYYSCLGCSELFRANTSLGNPNGWRDRAVTRVLTHERVVHGAALMANPGVPETQKCFPCNSGFFSGADYEDHALDCGNLRDRKVPCTQGKCTQRLEPHEMVSH
jgi:hypothetical protein